LTPPGYKLKKCKEPDILIYIIKQKMSSIKQTLSENKQKLRKNDLQTAQLDAEVLLSFVLKKPKEFLYTYPEKELTDQQIKTLDRLINKRAQHTPLAYLTGHKEFFGLDFLINENVLVPRPETELLVEQAQQYIKEKKNRKTPLSVAEIGTGSGCIAVSLAKTLPQVQITATDISAKALEIAKLNAKKHQTTDKIKFFQGNLLKPIFEQKFKVIIANLPYLDENHKNLLKSSDEKALKFEPPQALYAGSDGLDAYRDFFQQVKTLPYKPELILVEIGQDQSPELKKFINSVLPQAEIREKKDLAAKNRVLRIKL